MKIYNFLSVAAACTLTLGLAASCDNISEPDRIQEVEIAPAQRMVVLEEFTGQNCTNCPEGHDIVHSILEVYPDAFIPVSIHASSFSISEENGGLGTPEGAEYYLNSGQPALPSGVVNRQGGNIDRSDWTAAVSRIIKIETPLTIGLKASLDESGKNIDIAVNLLSTSPLSGNLQLWILEDNITAYQLDHGMPSFAYTHNHVLRGAANGTWGESVSLAEFEPVDVTNTAAVKDGWNTDNLVVVAFLYNDSGIVNANRVSVKAYGDVDEEDAE